MKTSYEIRTDIYNIIKQSELKSFILSNNGNIYKNDDRPINSHNNDLCIAVRGNLLGMHQRASISVDIYSNDIQQGNNSISDINFIRLAEKQLTNLFSIIDDKDYKIRLESLDFGKVENNQHMICAILSIEYLNLI